MFKELRKRNPELKVIFVSGYAEEAFSKSLPEGGQFTFLAKPFTLKQLVATVKETGANLVGLSSLLTTTMIMQKKVIDALGVAGLLGLVVLGLVVR